MSLPNKGTGAGGAEVDVVEAEGLATALAQGEQGIGQHRHGFDRHRKGSIGTGQAGRANSGTIHLRTLIGGNLKLGAREDVSIVLKRVILWRT